MYTSSQVWVFVSEETAGDECSNENHSHNQTSWEPSQATICATGLRAASDGRFAWPTLLLLIPLSLFLFRLFLYHIVVLLTRYVMSQVSTSEGSISVLIQNTAFAWGTEGRRQSSTFFTPKKYYIPRQRSTKFTTKLKKYDSKDYNLNYFIQSKSIFL